MIAHVAGRVTKSGTSEYGGWFTVAEVIRKRDGGKFEKVTFCSGKDEPPAENDFVAVQGYVRAEVDEYTGRDGEKKTAAKVKLQAAQWLPVLKAAGDESAPDDLDGDTIPF